jgi:hypothetical protein
MEGDIWPQWPKVRKDDYGQLEATALQGCDPRQWAVDTLEVLHDEGRVNGLRVVSLDWSCGKPKQLAETERVIPAQLVLLAMDVVPDEAIRLLSILTGVPEDAIFADPAIGLDGAAELAEAFWRLNGMENFTAAAARLAANIRRMREKTGCSA